jgi:hypothetical protein
MIAFLPKGSLEFKKAKINLNRVRSRRGEQE